MENARLRARSSLVSSKNARCLLVLSCIVALYGCGESGGKPQAPSQSAQGTPEAGRTTASTDPSDDTVPAQPLAPGHYATKHGWGQLTIASEQQGTSDFSLETLNAGYGCSFAGKLHDARGTVYDGGNPGTCILEIARTQNGLTIRSTKGTEGYCREYCGNNGSFEGDYLKLGAACEPAAVQRTRKAFQGLYDRKDYAKAETLLAPVYHECLSTSSLADEGAIRNDYAITRHKLGDDDACLEALAPYRDDADRSDEAITDGMAPAIVDDYLAVIHAARTNLKLCGHVQAR